MAGTASFRDLVVWQKAMDLVEKCYDLTRTFPREEQFVLLPQLRRAAISIPSNIAEGQRLSKVAFRAYLNRALASEAELETQVELCMRLRLIDRPTAAAVTGQAEEIARLLRGLIRSLGRTRTGDSVAVKTVRGS